MNLSQKKPFSFICLAGIPCFLLLCAYAVNKGKKEVYAHISTIFEEVITQDCNNRLGETRRWLQPLGRKVKGVETTTYKGVETVHFDDSLDERTANRLMFQHAMLDNNPLQPDAVNTLFKKALEQHQISTQATGVIYQYKGLKEDKSPSV